MAPPIYAVVDVNRPVIGMRALWVVTALLTWFGAGPLLGQEKEADKEKKEDRPQQYRVPLRSNPDNLPGWKIIGLDGDKWVRFESQGLRISVPEDADNHRDPAGLSTGIHLSGDFDVAVHFEVLKEPSAQDPARKPTQIALILVHDKGKAGSAGLARRLVTNLGLQFAAWPDDTKSEQPKTISLKEGLKGSLRATRVGSQLTLAASSQPEPKYETVAELTAKDDFKDVRLIASTGSPKATLDVRFWDLEVNMGEVSPSSPAPLPPEEPFPWNQVLLPPLVILVLILVFLRSRNARGSAEKEDPATAAASFRCPHCATRLKRRPELAGKKMKCPQCGQSVAVPAK